MSKDLSHNLLPNNNQVGATAQEPKLSTESPPSPTDGDYEYKEFGAQPRIPFSKLTLSLLGPALVVLYIRIAKFFEIPLIQYCFVSSLTAFLVNYCLIIRKYELMPYLPIEPFDRKLKILCVASITGLLLSLYLGWNGSGGILFAMFWEFTRGSKMDMYKLYFALVIAGSILMENNYSVSKLWELIPGLLFGYVNSELFKLQSSNPYTITHQFVFLCAIGFPIFFPASNLIVPNLWQWILMVLAGGLLLVGLLLVIKLMQDARVSVVMGVMSGLLMLGTAKFLFSHDWIGAILIVVGVALLLKKQFVDDDY